MKTQDADHALQGDVEIVSDFVVPCGHCGATCTGTFRLWYVDDGKRKTFEVDRLTFSELLGAVVEAATDEDAYRRLPVFVRNWNECVGWAGLDDAAPIDTADLLAAVEALKAHTAGDARLVGILASLHDFVVQGHRRHRELWAGET